MSSVCLEPDPSRIIESLRDTGYSFNTAIADIIDNSIAANATVIKISVSLLPGERVVPIVMVADNGDGMDESGLKNAMTYGSKKRDDPSSLGKFGLGLKTASTAFCRKLSVISRGKNDPKIRKYQWNLDYVAKTKKWEVLELSPTEDEIDILEEISQGESGTLVTWENVDRLLQRNYSTVTRAANALERIRSILKFHLAVVYQRFLDPNFKEVQTVKLFLNDELIEAWDPFCRNEAHSELLNKPTPITVTSPSGDKIPITLNAYAIPRSDQFSTKEARDKAKISTNTLGFYVYRENRLIHYGDWLGMFKIEPHDSLLRIEFSFNHKLDDYFQIDIKKSRVQLAEELYDYIKDKFLPAPKRHAQQKYRQGCDEKVAVVAKSAHLESNKSIDDRAPSAEQAKIEIVDSEKNTVKVTNKNGVFQHSIIIEDDPPPEQCRVIPKEDLEGGALWEPCIAEQKHAVIINTKHDYYQKIYYPLLANKNAVIGMDSLLWALAESEHATYNEDVKEVYEDIRLQVSMALKKLIRDLPDPELPEKE